MLPIVPMPYAELRTMSFEIAEKAIPSLLEVLTTTFGWNLRPPTTKQRERLFRRLRRALLGMRGYVLGLELLTGRLGPAHARHAFLEGLLRQYRALGGKKLGENDDACLELLRFLEQQALAHASHARLPKYVEVRAAVDEFVSALAPHSQSPHVIGLATIWAQSDDARKLAHFGKRLPAMARGWRRTTPKRLTDKFVVAVTNQLRDCVVVFEQCIRRFVALDQASRGLPVSWDAMAKQTLDPLLRSACAGNSTPSLERLAAFANLRVRNVLAHGHPTANPRTRHIEFRNDGQLVVAWTPEEAFEQAWTLTACVLAMLKFDEQLQFVTYRNSLNMLAEEVNAETNAGSWWTPARVQVHRWLEDKSPPLAELYEGAVKLLFASRDVGGRLRFVAHAVREIRNRLPDAVEPGVRKRLQYEAGVDHLKRSLAGVDLGAMLDGREPVLPREAIESIQALLLQHNEVGERNIEAAHRLFSAATHSGRGDFLRPLARSWYKVGQWFMHDVHVGTQGATVRDEQEYVAHFLHFEAILCTLAADFFTPLDRLDAILSDPSSTLDAALVHLGGDQQVRYFFERLDRPDWVRELHRRGFFADPPKSIVEDAGRFVRFPPWPALGYLSRVAARSATDVLAAATSVPATDNLSVQAGLLDVAIALPGVQAAKLLPKLRPFLGGSAPLHTLLEHRIEALLGQLAKARESAAADDVLNMAARVLAPRSEYTPPGTRMPMWSYSRLFSTNTAALLEADGERFFKRVVHLLRAAARFSANAADATAGRDFSRGWMESVAHRGGNDDPRGVLVDALKCAALHLTVDEVSTARFVGLLEAERLSIFKRIALFVVTERRVMAPALATERLMRHDLFDNHETGPEYGQLVKEHFDALQMGDQALWFSWLDQGPELSHLDQHYTPGNPSLADRKRERRERSQLDKLSLLTSRPDEWQARFVELAKQYGMPDAGPRRMGEAWVGPTSPFEISDLRSLGVDDLVAKLRAWVPPEGWMVPTPAGIGHQLAELVAETPARYADTDKFTTLEPTYVRSIIEGFQGALNQNRDVPWEAVVRLTEWILGQPLIHHNDDDFDRDVGWRATRMSTARIFSSGFAGARILHDLRGRSWRCLERLLDDVDPTPENEDARIGNGIDAAHLSLNATRSIALNAALHYGAWIRDHVGAEGFSLSQVPELRLALERHLDPTIDASRAVRWVYGRWFRVLAAWDTPWATSHVDSVFGNGESGDELGRTAWNAFVSTTAADKLGYSLLSAQYAFAVDRLGDGVPVAMQLHSPNEQLGHSLVRLYWLGVIELGADQSPLRRFYELAPIELRANVMDFVGRCLHGTKESDLSAAIASRLRTLWEVRIKALAPIASAERDAELEAFGWWFAAGNLGERWLLEQLEAALRVYPRVDSSMFVVERLAALAGAHPVSALRCLELLVRGDSVGWSIDSWKRHAEFILRLGLANPETEAAARALINELGRRGFHEYRSLLGPA